MFFDFRAQLMRNQVQRLFVHRAVFDCINCAAFSLGPIFKPAFEHVDDGRFTTADRSHQQQDSFAYFETLCRGFEVFDNSRDWFFDAEEFGRKEVVGEDFVLSAFVESLDASRMNHVVDACV